MIMALLKDKTALITGGSAGIGLATAKRFVEEGAYVFINGRSQAELDAAVKEIGENVTGVQGDGSKQGDRDRLYTAVADTGRGLDVVFANAAAIDVARIGEVTQEHLQKGAAATERRRINHPELVGHECQGQRRPGRVRGEHGGAAIIGPHLGQ